MAWVGRCLSLAVNFAVVEWHHRDFGRWGAIGQAEKLILALPSLIRNHKPEVLPWSPLDTEVGELFLAKDDVDEAKNVARESRDIFQDHRVQALNPKP